MNRKPASEAPEFGAAALVEELIGAALSLRATDIHFEPIDQPAPGLQVRLRIDGLLHDDRRIAPPEADQVIGRLKVLGSLLTYRTDIPQEGGVRFALRTHDESHQVDLRISSFPTVRGERVVVRIFPLGHVAPDLADLGFSQSQADQMRAAACGDAGLIVATGPAGAGKTTTLYALLTHIRRVQPWRSVISVEDPVEQRLEGVTQIQIQPHGELNYERCMRSLLRQDPQVLMVGEIRDAQTAEIAIEAAFTGHVVLTTLHSGTCAGAMLRLLEMGIPPYQLAGALALVIAQRLLRRRNVISPCKPAGPIPYEYSGRTACAEVVQLDESLRQVILRQPMPSTLQKAIQGRGLTLRQSAAVLADRGVTDLKEIERVLGPPPADAADSRST